MNEAEFNERQRPEKEEDLDLLKVKLAAALTKLFSTFLQRQRSNAVQQTLMMLLFYYINQATI